jgi:hypothetical protein
MPSATMASVKHLFDQLPTDMIYYEIFPYLDYNSRVTANLLLPHKDRLSIPLRKDAVLELSIKMASDHLTSLIFKQRDARSNLTRNRLSLKIWRTLPLYPELVQYNSRFRAIVIEKSKEFSDPDLENVLRISSYTRKQLKKLCEGFIISLETTFPFVRDVSMVSEGWSAVVA